MFKILGATAAATAMILGCSSAQAAEGGQSPYLKGFRDIQAGIVPPEVGGYMRNDLYYYSGKVSKTVLNGRVQAKLDVDSAANITTMTYVTGAHLFGGQYAVGAFVPLVYADISASASGPLGNSAKVGDDAFGIGDIGIIPIMLGWHNGNVHTSLSLPIYVPVGSYDTDNLANLGKNYWALMPSFSISWFEPKSGWDASGAVTYVATTENSDTDYDTGDLLHIDAAVTKGSGAWRLGLAGYAQMQVTGDTGTGAVLGGHHSDVYALGPIVSYTAKIGERPVNFYGKWYHEFGAKNTLEGDAFTLAFALKF